MKLRLSQGPLTVCISNSVKRITLHKACLMILHVTVHLQDRSRQWRELSCTGHVRAKAGCLCIAVCMGYKLTRLWAYQPCKDCHQPHILQYTAALDRIPSVIHSWHELQLARAANMHASDAVSVQVEALHADMFSSSHRAQRGMSWHGVATHIWLSLQLSQHIVNPF